MNINKLKSVMALNGDTQGDLAKFLGISLPGLGNKIHRRTDFKQGEIQEIKGRYNLTAEEIDEIFF